MVNIEYIKKAVIIFSLAIILVGCGRKEKDKVSYTRPAQRPSPSPVAETQEAELPKYYYKGTRFRDPFVPATGGFGYAHEGEDAVFNIEELVLTGIVAYQAGRKKEAIFSGSGGRGFVLRNNRLYDMADKEIKGVAGMIKHNAVAVISQDNKVKEFPVSKDGEIIEAR